MIFHAGSVRSDRRLVSSSILASQSFLHKPSDLSCAEKNPAQFFLPGLQGRNHHDALLQGPARTGQDVHFFNPQFGKFLLQSGQLTAYRYAARSELGMIENNCGAVRCHAGAGVHALAPVPVEGYVPHHRAATPNLHPAAETEFQCPVL